MERRGVVRAVMGAVAGAVLTAAGTGWAQQEDQAPAVRKARPSLTLMQPSDQQVVEAIKKGAEFLLSTKKNNNWESYFDATGKPLHPKIGADGKQEVQNGVLQWETWPGQNFGGETAIAVYALLHVGKSMQDDKIAERLDYKSEDLKAAIKFLCDLEPTATYTAGLQANALALVWKSDRPDIKDGLENARAYILTGMGADGGYTYTASTAGDDVGFGAVWQAYWKAKGTNNATAIKDTKGKLDGVANSMQGNFGGVAAAIEAMELNIKAKARKDPNNAGWYNAEINELRKYASEIKPPAATDFQKRLKDAQKALDEAKEAEKTGKAFKTDPRTKQQVPKTKQEIDQDLKSAEAVLAAAKVEMDSKFNPRGDLSNGQYGTLGAWALEGHIEVPTKYWEVADRFWHLTQQQGGAWAYSSTGGPESLTMTVAGVASLFITTEYTDTQLRLQAKPDKQLDAGLAWLEKNYQPRGGLYYMYALERVGLASGYKFFANTNWYREGAKNVLAMQAADGSWNDYNQTVGTSYALLFLARGRNPVAFNKLEYPGNTWNARPRDVAHLAENMSKELDGKGINWQIVSLKNKAEEWLDGAVLVITGSQDPKFTKDDLDKLRAYVEGGGIIFSSADGNSEAFTKAMQGYMAKICLDEDGKARFEPRQLPRDHIIFTTRLGWLPVDNPPTIIGLSNGVRELWIHSPQDCGASWQMRKTAQKNDFAIPLNICNYITGGSRLMRSRLEPLTVPPPKDKPMHSLALGRVKYDDGTWDPEPGAWPRMAKLAAVDFKLDLKLSEASLDELDKLDPKAVPMIHLTGTTRFKITDARVAGLRAYLDKGGMLFIDAAGGREDFIAAALDVLTKVYPDGTGVPAPLPPNHTLYSGRIPDSEVINQITLRKAAKLKVGGNNPRLMGITQNGQLKVIYSELDLTSGLLGTDTLGIVGYSADSAESLVGNVLLYAAEGEPQAPASAPAATPAK